MLLNIVLLYLAAFRIIEPVFILQIKILFTPDNKNMSMQYTPSIKKQNTYFHKK